MTRVSTTTSIALPQIGSWGSSAHKFDELQLEAIEAASLSGRPLLVRGEPGLGKSQIARAIAAVRQWRLVTTVINGRTEIDDLLYSIDHVRRLSDANLNLRKNRLNLRKYIDKGPIWRALERDAKDLSSAPSNKGDKGYYVPKDGCVLLIDEIDKAHSDIPNSLLEVLDGSSFQVPATGQLVSADKSSIFVVVTANEEKALPPAFLRRCAVLCLDLGEQPVDRLVDIAMAHIEFGLFAKINKKICTVAANKVIEYRNGVSVSEYRPGSSEYLDLLRVIDKKLENKSLEENAVLDTLDSMSNFLIKKQYRSDTIV